MTTSKRGILGLWWGLCGILLMVVGCQCGDVVGPGDTNKPGDGDTKIEPQPQVNPPLRPPVPPKSVCKDPKALACKHCDIPLQRDETIVFVHSKYVLLQSTLGKRLFDLELCSLQSLSWPNLQDYKSIPRGGPVNALVVEPGGTKVILNGFIYTDNGKDTQILAVGMVDLRTGKVLSTLSFRGGAGSTKPPLIAGRGHFSVNNHYTSTSTFVKTIAFDFRSGTMTQIPEDKVDYFPVNKLETITADLHLYTGMLKGAFGRSSDGIGVWSVSKQRWGRVLKGPIPLESIGATSRFFLVRSTPDLPPYPQQPKVHAEVLAYPLFSEKKPTPLSSDGCRGFAVDTTTQSVLCIGPKGLQVYAGDTLQPDGPVLPMPPTARIITAWKGNAFLLLENKQFGVFDLTTRKITRYPLQIEVSTWRCLARDHNTHLLRRPRCFLFGAPSLKGDKEEALTHTVEIDLQSRQLRGFFTDQVGLPTRATKYIVENTRFEGYLDSLLHMTSYYRGAGFVLLNAETLKPFHREANASSLLWSTVRTTMGQRFTVIMVGAEHSRDEKLLIADLKRQAVTTFDFTTPHAMYHSDTHVVLLPFRGQSQIEPDNHLKVYNLQR